MLQGDMELDDTLLTDHKLIGFQSICFVRQENLMGPKSGPVQVDICISDL